MANLIGTSKILAFCFLFAYVDCPLASEPRWHLEQEQVEKFLQGAEAGDVNVVKSISRGKEAVFSALLAEVLKEARNSGLSWTDTSRLRRSLAALGHSGAREEVIRDLSSPDLYAREGAFEDAAILGGNDMIFSVGEALFDPSPGGIPEDSNGNKVMDVRVPATRHLAALTLSRLVAESEGLLVRFIGTDDEVESLRIWWLRNKNRYMD